MVFDLGTVVSSKALHWQGAANGAILHSLYRPFVAVSRQSGRIDATMQVHLYFTIKKIHGILIACRRKYPSAPFTLQMPGAKFHVFSSPDTAFEIFTKPRNFIFEPVVASMMSNGLELDGEDLQKFDVPLISDRKDPNLTPAQRESYVFTQRNHSLYLKYLSGKTLTSIMQVYRENFLYFINRMMPVEKETTKSLNLHKVLQRLIFETSCVTFFGTRVHQVSPDIWSHWDSFNKAAYIGVRSRASFYLRPWTLGGRQRMLQAFDKWCDTELEPWPEEAGLWNKKWGVKLNWERERMARDHNMTLRGRSAVHVSFFWV